jgi:hypothetical protein
LNRAKVALRRVYQPVPDVYTDYDNRYPDWVPISYDLRAEYALETPESEFTGMPNKENTKAWDEIITRSFSSPQTICRTLELIKTLNSNVLLGFPRGSGKDR